MKPSNNFGLRSFFDYLKDSFRVNELENQVKVKLIFVIIMLVYGGALLPSTLIAESLQNGSSLDAFTKAVTELFNNPLLYDSANQAKTLSTFVNTIAPFANVIQSLVVLAVLNYFPYFLVSIIMLIYARELMIHHLPLVSENFSKISKVFWKALLVQILILPIGFFTVNGSDFLTLMLFAFLNSIYWFGVFSLFDYEKYNRPSFGYALKSAFSLYKTRFLKLLIVIVLLQGLISIAILGINILMDSFNRPTLTASVDAFCFAVFQFATIRFLFHIFKDLKYPELIISKDEDE